MLWRRPGHRDFDRARLSRLAVRGLAAGAGVFTLVLIAACGGDEGGSGYSPVVAEPMTKVEFLREADRICHSSEARIEAAADDLLRRPGGPRPREVRRVALGVAVPALEAEVRAIGALEPPPGDEREIAAILAATRRGIAQIQAEPGRLAERPPPGLREAQRLAQRYGSRQCGFR